MSVSATAVYVCTHCLVFLSVSQRHTHICSSKRSIIYQRLYLTISSSVFCFSCVSSSCYGAGLWVKEKFLSQLKVCMCIGATGCGHVLRKITSEKQTFSWKCLCQDVLNSILFFCDSQTSSLHGSQESLHMKDELSPKPDIRRLSDEQVASVSSEYLPAPVLSVLTCMRW